MISGLYAQYHFNEVSGTVAADNYINNYTGTINGTITFATGKLNGAFTLGGSGNYVSVNNSSYFNWERTQTFSFECWFKTTNTVGTLFSKSDGTKVIQMYLSSGRIYTHFINTPTSNDLVLHTNSAYNDGNWKHLVMTYNGSSSTSGVTIYIDGSAVATTVDRNGLSATILNSGYMSFGVNTNTVTMDEVAFYTKVLSAGEVTSQYNGGSGTEGDTAYVGSSDTVTFTESTTVNVPIERLALGDTLSLSEVTVSSLQKSYEELDTITVSETDLVQMQIRRYETVTLTPTETATAATVVRAHSSHTFTYLLGVDLPITNDFRTQKEVFGVSFLNDFRFKASWQVPAAGGIDYLSPGKEFIRVYINYVDQTDVDVDTINIERVFDGASTASFNLGRAYDATRPTLEQKVEIHYYPDAAAVWVTNDAGYYVLDEAGNMIATSFNSSYVLFSGYITSINPTDDPEHIAINCQDAFWYNNRTQSYFNVGQVVSGTRDLFYPTIAAGMSALGWNPGIGNFTPESISCFATGVCDARTTLVNESGNYNWFYDVTGSPKLRISGSGKVTNLPVQVIGTNIGLYQIIRMSWAENVDDLVNKFRVQMGDKITKKFSSNGAANDFACYVYRVSNVNAVPAWDPINEELAKDMTDGYGFDYVQAGTEHDYKDVFKKYKLTFKNNSWDEWTDYKPPEVTLSAYTGGYGSNVRHWIDVEPPSTKPIKITEGFSVDYEEGTITFNNPIFMIMYEKDKKVSFLANYDVKIKICQNQYFSYTADTTDNPEEDIANPLMFFVGPMGTYPVSVVKTLELSQFSIQYGGTYVDADGTTQVVPSWDDTAFATDYANWQLSKVCDTKITGSLDITIDALCYYGLDLDGLVKVDEVYPDNDLNIQSISINVGSFIATINVGSERYYNRTVSLPSHGE